MKTKISKKRAISTVLTTVIVLVSSVVLDSGVESTVSIYAGKDGSPYSIIVQGLI